jgi:uncharacterized protein YbjT (DUF2867 family)
MALDGVVAVVGATGRQGGAAAAAVQAAGAQLVVADFDHPDTVDAALQGASRVFAMTTMDSGRGTEGETTEQLRHEFRAVDGIAVPFSAAIPRHWVHSPGKRHGSVPGWPVC